MIHSYHGLKILAFFVILLRLPLFAEKTDSKNFDLNEEAGAFEEEKVEPVCSYPDFPERKKLIYLSPFSKLEERFQIKVLNQWIGTIKDYENKYYIEKRSVKNANQNEGIFSVHGDTEQKFIPGIIKVITKTKDCREFKKMWRLNQIRFEESKCADKAIEQTTGSLCCGWFAKRNRTYQPIVPRIISWAEGPEECFMFEEMAQGVTAQTYLNGLRMSKKIEFYEKIGKMAAAFHFRVTEDSSKNLSDALLWSHGDLHIGNIIYDEKKDQFSLIDLDRMKQSLGIEKSRIIYDYHQITSRNIYAKDWVEKLKPFLNMYFSEGTNKIDDSLKALSESDRSLLLAHRVLNDGRAKLVNEAIMQWYSEATQEVKDRVLPPFYFFQSEIENLEKEIPKFQAFIHGYLKNTPPQLVSSVEEQFKGICKEIPDTLFAVMKIQGDEWKKVQDSFFKGPLKRLEKCRVGNFEAK